MSTGTLKGLRVTHASVSLPAWGMSYAEAALDQEATLSGQVELVIADLRLSCTILSGGPGPVGRSSFKMVVGAGGWGRTIPDKSYANDAGVKASAVLADAAAACGETIDATTLPSTRLGPSWSRDEAPASRTLALVSPANWYVGEDGVTRVGRRSAVTFKAAAQILGVDRSRSIVRIAADQIATILPGITVEGVEAVDVLHELDPGGLRSTIWGGSSTRALTAMQRIVEQLDPDRKFRGTHEYRVGLQVGQRYSLQAMRVSQGMPDLQLVPVRAGVPGARADLALGSRVLVQFIDIDPARPAIVGFDEFGSFGFQPSALELGETEDLTPMTALNTDGRYLRYGDKIVFLGPGPGVLAAPSIPGSVSTLRSGS